MKDCSRGIVIVVGCGENSKLDPATVSICSVLIGYSSIVMIERCVYSLIFYNVMYVDYLLRSNKS